MTNGEGEGSPHQDRTVINERKLSIQMKSFLFHGNALFLICAGLGFITRHWQNDEGKIKTLYGFGTIPRTELHSLTKFIKATVLQIT